MQTNTSISNSDTKFSIKTSYFSPHFHLTTDPKHITSSAIFTTAPTYYTHTPSRKRRINPSILPTTDSSSNKISKNPSFNSPQSSQTSLQKSENSQASPTLETAQFPSESQIIATLNTPDPNFHFSRSDTSPTEFPNLNEVISKLILGAPKSSQKPPLVTKSPTELPSFQDFFKLCKTLPPTGDQQIPSLTENTEFGDNHLVSRRQSHHETPEKPMHVVYRFDEGSIEHEYGQFRPEEIQQYQEAPYDRYYREAYNECNYLASPNESEVFYHQASNVPQFFSEDVEMGQDMPVKRLAFEKINDCLSVISEESDEGYSENFETREIFEGDGARESPSNGSIHVEYEHFSGNLLSSTRNSQSRATIIERNPENPLIKTPSQQIHERNRVREVRKALDRVEEGHWSLQNQIWDLDDEIAVLDKSLKFMIAEADHLLDVAQDRKNREQAVFSLDSSELEQIFS